MNHTPLIGYALERALGMAALGWKLVPIPFGGKHPKGFGKWQDLATDDEATIRDWFETTNHGVGWAMGSQPNGKFVFALDVEHDGSDALVELIRTDGGGDAAPFMATASQRTGGDGAHYIFETSTLIRNSAKQFADHIDVRGEGGQILIGPTIHPNGNPYVWAKLPDEHRPLPAPKWVLDRIEAQGPSITVGETIVSPTQLPLSKFSGLAGLSSSDDSPADWVRRNIPVSSLLIEGGWVLESTRGEDTYWARPGKEARDGHSAVLHGDAPFVCWSTNAPPAFESCGRDNFDGSFTLSPIEVYAAVHFGGNLRLASSHVRKSLMSRVERNSTGNGQSSTVQAPNPLTEGGRPETSDDLNLPPEFWDSRADLAQIRDAAWNRGMSPDSALGGLLTRISTITPVGYRIPPMVGSHGTFDHISVLVSHSSGGKTSSANIARELLPDVLEKTIIWDYPAPSGEGLVDAFFEMVDDVDENGKKTRQKRQTKDAVHFTMDEAMALISQTQRSGTTIASVILSAWSGSTIGQGNASDDRKRVLKRGKARVAGLMGIQSRLGHLMLTDALVDQGLAGRLVFFAAEDPSLPDRDKVPQEFPGPLGIQPLPVIGGGKLIEYPDEVWEEVRTAHWARQRLEVVEHPIDGHLRLVRLKLAGLLAFMEGRPAVTISDWDLAGMVVASSKRIRSQMLTYRSEATTAANVTKGTSAAVVANAQEDADRRIKISKASAQILTIVKAGGPIRKKALKNKIPSPLRGADILNTALDELLEARLLKCSAEGDYS